MASKSNRMYGEQTARYLEYFNIGLPSDEMPSPIIKAFALLKKVYANLNMKYGLSTEIGLAISDVCDNIIDDAYNDQFPLSIWQSISGKQTNINVNEVIANVTTERLGLVIGNKPAIHPIEHVNKNQSLDGSLLIVIHIATLFELGHRLYPAFKHFQKILTKKRKDFSEIFTHNQTHLEDFISTIDEKFSTYLYEISHYIQLVQTCQSDLFNLNIDCTFIESTLDKQEFARNFIQCLHRHTDMKFINVPNKFDEINTYNIMVQLSGALNTLSVSLINIVDDILGFCSRTRDIVFFENVELENSVMSEAMAMVAAQISSNHVCVTNGLTRGVFQLNVFNSLVVKSILYSIRIMSDMCNSITNNIVARIQLITNSSKNNLSILSIDNSSTAPHSQKVGAPEKFIQYSSSAYTSSFSSINEPQLATTTTQTNTNKCDIEGKELVIRRELNVNFQPGGQSLSSGEQLTPLGHSFVKSNNNTYEGLPTQQPLPIPQQSNQNYPIILPSQTEVSIINSIAEGLKQSVNRN